MLTIKHIDTDGTETVIEAERVEVVQGKGQFEDGIFIDPTYHDPVIGRSGRGGQAASQAGGDHPATLQPAPTSAADMRSFRHVIHYARARSSTDCDPRVYVMNRFGATVATYHL